MAALSASQISADLHPQRDSQYRREVWAYTTTTTGAADEWIDVGSEIVGLGGAVAVQAGAAATPNFVMNASGTSVTAGTNPGNLGVETNNVSGTHTFHVTVIVR